MAKTFPFGLSDMGTIRAPYGHILVAGGTGAGKSSFWWTALNGVKTVHGTVFFLDSKGESFALKGKQVKPLNFAYLYEDYLQIIETVEKILEVRKSSPLNQNENAFEVFPPVFLFIDEYTNFSTMLVDNNSHVDKVSRGKMQNALGNILREGRSLNVFVYGAGQDTEKLTTYGRDKFMFISAMKLSANDRQTLKDKELAEINQQIYKPGTFTVRDIETNEVVLGKHPWASSQEFKSLLREFILDELPSAIPDGLVPEPFCERCGATLSSEQATCPECGYDLSSAIDGGEPSETERR
ncbi:MAG: hypothetical protein QM632_02860 [Micrococcaceae bacterium]